MTDIRSIEKPSKEEEETIASSWNFCPFKNSGLLAHDKDGHRDALRSKWWFLEIFAIEISLSNMVIGIARTFHMAIGMSLCIGRSKRLGSPQQTGPAREIEWPSSQDRLIDVSTTASQWTESTFVGILYQDPKVLRDMVQQ